MDSVVARTMPMEGDVMSASQATGTSPTANPVSAMDMQQSVWRRQGSVLSAGTGQMGSTVRSARRAFMEIQGLTISANSYKHSYHITSPFFRFGVDIPCRECPCPNTKASGHSFADRCYLDTNTNEPICECKEGYESARCSVCADNHFGNPEIPGGKCIKCNCSNNWIESETGNCDPSSGVCLKCQFNTEGDHCEYCKPGKLIVPTVDHFVYCWTKLSDKII